MRWEDYVKEVVEFNDSIIISSDMARLHTAFNDLMEEAGEPKLPNIDGIIIVDNDDTANAINSLVNGLVTAFSMRHENITDDVIVGNITYDLHRKGACSGNINIEFTLMMKPGVVETQAFNEMRQAFYGNPQWGWKH